MDTVTGYTSDFLEPVDYHVIPTGSFRIASASKKSKTIEFFDDLYTDPPKFRVKWNTIDELHNDLFMSYNYRVLNPNFPFLDASADVLLKEDNKAFKETNYSFNAYFDGYLNKILSTRFYGKQAKKLQGTLQTVPVYVILNGRGEIVLATSTNSVTSTKPTLHEAAYNVCGNFDSFTERSKQLGLFFMSKNDAEVYLQEIAKSDTQGTKTFGLAIHCFSLDFAYRVTREYHPNVDFRFIPDLEEIQSLMTAKNTQNSNFVFEDGQQQLRFRRRGVNIVPILGKLNKWVSPFSSFLEKTEYFKGVPIFIVNVDEMPKNFVVECYSELVHLLGCTSGQVTNALNTLIGFGNTNIRQGSLQKQTSSHNTKTYIFFDKMTATQFCQRYSRQISRYSYSQSGLFDSFSKKPKILVHNLEDFLEMWEETLTPSQIEGALVKQKMGVDVGKITFVPSKQAALDIDGYLKQNKKSPIQIGQQFFDFKYKRLVGFLETLINTN